MTDIQAARVDIRQHLSSLKRGLKGLSMLSERGRLTATEFARELRIPRTTAHRVLQTLVVEGYAERNPYKHGYRLTPTICALARGYSDENWIAHVASPLLFQKTREIRWPLFIATRAGAYMEVRVSTDAASPLALDHYRSGHLVPIMFCSSGQVMIAFSSPGEREALLKLLKNSPDPLQSPARANSHMRMVVSRTNANGYANQSYPMYREASLAVPIFVDGCVKACLMMLYIKTAVPETKLTDEFVPLLQALAGRIGGDVARMKRGEAYARAALSRPDAYPFAAKAA